MFVDKICLPIVLLYMLIFIGPTVMTFEVDARSLDHSLQKQDAPALEHSFMVTSNEVHSKESLELEKQIRHNLEVLNNGIRIFIFEFDFMGVSGKKLKHNNLNSMEKSSRNYDEFDSLNSETNRLIENLSSELALAISKVTTPVTAEKRSGGEWMGAFGPIILRDLGLGFLKLFFLNLLWYFSPSTFAFINSFSISSILGG